MADWIDEVAREIQDYTLRAFQAALRGRIRNAEQEVSDIAMLIRARAPQPEGAVPTADYEAVARELLIAWRQQWDMTRDEGEWAGKVEANLESRIASALSTADNKVLRTCPCGDVFNELFRGVCPNCVATELSAAQRGST